MRYRRFGRLDWEASVLGFGAMRLPIVGKDMSAVDEPETIRMIRRAIDAGVNYVDTAYPYHEGRSEVVVGRALRDGYREKVRLATKLPSWNVKTLGDCDELLNGQLKKLQTDRVDFYLLHGLNRTQWPRLRDLGVLRWAEGAAADGRIGHLGFSFHDDFELFREIVDGHDWPFCQIQYNFMDTEYQAGTRGLRYAAEKGIAVVVMEPLRGGQLAKEPPPSVARLWEGAPVRRAPADWALQWVWSHPEVSVALSGMSAMEDVEANLRSADRSAPGLLTAEEMALVGRVREEYRKLSPVPCTKCKYCMPCPSGVEIPYILEYYNDAVMYDHTRGPRFRYRQLAKEKQADQCTECFECEEKCPQAIPITEWLKKAHELLGQRK